MAKPCIECGVERKDTPSHRCVECNLRHRPMSEQIAAARQRKSRSEVNWSRSYMHKHYDTPAGRDWCAGCQTWRMLADFGKGQTQCKPCVAGRNAASRDSRVYGVTPDDIATIRELQGNRCAICRNGPGVHRDFARDHDHQTQVFRGLLCATCNHDLLGAAHDSIAMLEAALMYLKYPPTSGAWLAPETYTLEAVVRLRAQAYDTPTKTIYSEVSTHTGNWPEPPY